MENFRYPIQITVKNNILKLCYRLFFLMLAGTLLRCGPSSNFKENLTLSSPALNSISIEYAKGFSIDHRDGYKIIKTRQTSKNTKQEKVYILIPKEGKIPAIPQGATVIQTPVKEVVCFSTSHIPFLEMIGEQESLTGFPQTDFISSPLTRERIEAGKVKDIGPDTGFNPEILLELHPQLVFAYSMGQNLTKYELLENAGIPVALNYDYLEEHPLGRAEWIKFIAAFYDKEELADSVFNKIKSDYLDLKNRTASIQNKPRVFSGNLYGDIWYMPGGKSWPATFIKDAGGDFLWKEDTSYGSLELSFEVVLEKAMDGDFWINAGSFKSLSEIKDMDLRYGRFKAFKEQKIFNYHAKSGAKGGILYLELGYARPDIILADLIKILHPELLPEHNLFFYKQLN